MMNSVKVLILGANGMIGIAMFREFLKSPNLEVFGTIRLSKSLNDHPLSANPQIISGIDVENVEQLAKLLQSIKPDVVINCIGVVKQSPIVDQKLIVISLNALLPHRLVILCQEIGARLVHISTDCVFSGLRGMYTELDIPDPIDFYGRTKLMGEEIDYTNAITLRTSTIGHELGTSHGLIDWFLAQSGSVKGYKRAIFSGLPTLELARIVRDYIIPNYSLRGLYNVSASPISKFELLTLVAKLYGKIVDIYPDEDIVVDRSLDSTKFMLETNYSPPKWIELIQILRMSLGNNYV